MAVERKVFGPVLLLSFYRNKYVQRQIVVLVLVLLEQAQVNKEKSNYSRRSEATSWWKSMYRSNRFGYGSRLAKLGFCSVILRKDDESARRLQKRFFTFRLNDKIMQLEKQTDLKYIVMGRAHSKKKTQVSRYKRKKKPFKHRLIQRVSIVVIARLFYLYIHSYYSLETPI